MAFSLSNDMLQDLKQKQGEIRFRRALFRRQVEGQAVFDDEFDAAGIEDVLERRMVQTRLDFEHLRESGLRLTPYVEIGAERCQRALVLENDLGLQGAALDLSHDMLKSCAHYAARFGRTRLPMRICADVYRLPFRSNSLPFVFCYETLHHLPNLEPVLREIDRVLAPGGVFFFAEEPFRPALRVPLVRSKGGVRRNAGRNRVAKLLRRLFVAEFFNEDAYDVLDNHDLSLGDWLTALDIFSSGSCAIQLDRFRATVASGTPFIETLLRALGGSVGGVYRRGGELKHCAPTVDSALISPRCVAGDPEVPVARAGGFCISESGERFPIVDDVAVLLCPDLRSELYPGFLSLVE
jgi:SAM-dependent methyltransferase